MTLKLETFEEIYSRLHLISGRADDPLEPLKAICLEAETSPYPAEQRERMIAALISLELQIEMRKEDPMLTRSYVSAVVARNEDYLSTEEKKWLLSRYSVFSAAHAWSHENSTLASFLLQGSLALDDLNSEQRIMAAKIFRDSCELDLALQTLNNVNEPEAEFIKASCLRLGGNIEAANRIISKIEPQDKNTEQCKEAYIELGNSYIRGGFDGFFRISVETVNGIEDGDTAFLKQYIALSEPHSRHRSHIRRPDYLYRIYRESGRAVPQIIAYRDALVLLTDLKDMKKDLNERIEPLLLFVSKPWIGNVELRMHFLTAVINGLKGLGRFNESDAVSKEYKKLSLVLSQGKTDDSLLLASYHEKLLEMGNRIDRRRTSVFGVSSKVGTHALKSMADRWRGGVQQAQESKNRMQETLSQIFLQETQKNRGFWQKFYQLGWGTWLDLPDSIRSNIENSLYSSFVVSDEKIEKLVSDSLGRSRSTVFSEWDAVPIGSGSFAQVHRARLKSGEEVAVKVQYPDARQNARNDMKTLKNLSTVLEIM